MKILVILETFLREEKQFWPTSILQVWGQETEHSDGIRKEKGFLHFSCSLMKHLEHEMWCDYISLGSHVSERQEERPVCHNPGVDQGKMHVFSCQRCKELFSVTHQLQLCSQHSFFGLKFPGSISVTTWTVLEMSTKHGLNYIIFFFWEHTKIRKTGFIFLNIEITVDLCLYRPPNNCH